MPGHPKPPETFGLTGPSIVLDRRINAVRGDVADVALAGILFAPHYASPLPMSCVVPSAPLRERADDAAALTSELLYGETFHVLDINGGWAWGYCEADHYVGYVPHSALGALREGGWRVAVPETVTSLGETLFMGGSIDGEIEGDQLETPLGAIPVANLVDANAVLDPVAVAELFLDAPYLLGGRTVRGIDCSGLVQLAYAMAGTALPRDSDLQAGAAGTAIDRTGLARGDLAFFPGHVGMMLDADRMIHATGHFGKVVIEPLTDAEARIGGAAQVLRP